jgi:hypothetical protein
VVSLVAELRGHERQAAEELGEWKTHHEVRQSFSASPTAVTLALICTREQLEKMGGGRWRPFIDAFRTWCRELGGGEGLLIGEEDLDG